MRKLIFLVQIAILALAVGTPIIQSLLVPLLYEPNLIIQALVLLIPFVLSSMLLFGITNIFSKIIERNNEKRIRAIQSIFAIIIFSGVIIMITSGFYIFALHCPIGTELCI